MAQVLLELRSGRADFDTNTKIVTPKPDKGLLRLVKSLDDNLTHFIWMKRTEQTPELDLIVFPGEADFKKVTECSDGDAFLLEIKNTREKHFFWSQEPYKDKNQIFYEQICREFSS
eukprot:TRINITY_DN6389_c0_g1_i1.p1 TRINITY_DN6389_c0_g1~~TRINITY_DN6389_c0_g1_i1.p1  ORF type:complete len:130 (+),score=31.44 TRINITY_DN6389_c0_g1_i1:45-392(+)